ncbi:MAG TPA: CDP-alcohol phosphatidyltransferase family protein [Chitinophagaceae bacterium]|nr:CDP-alcohol phosphatidyltransferase family protein [Chitinophagaceae bacterium]
MKQIPNIFTLLNLFFGCCAIVYTMQSGTTLVSSPEGSLMIYLPEQIALASLFIGLAGLVDFLDGFVARLFKTTSTLGAQLDSLADAVSFGVAPGMILFQFLRLSFQKEANAMDVSIAWLMPAFILSCASAFRLAKFNTDSTQQYGFKGVPTPAVGLLVASFPLIYWYGHNDLVTQLLLNKWVLYGLIILLSWLMMSNLPIMALKFKDYGLKNNVPKLILLAIAVIAGVLLKWVAVPVVFIAYIALSLALKNKTT